MVIDSAYDDHFDAAHLGDAIPSGEDEVSVLKPYFDGSASWFT